jgi:hypothetical protein
VGANRTNRIDVVAGAQHKADEHFARCAVREELATTRPAHGRQYLVDLREDGTSDQGN